MWTIWLRRFISTQNDGMLDRSIELVPDGDIADFLRDLLNDDTSCGSKIPGILSRLNECGRSHDVAVLRLAMDAKEATWLQRSDQEGDTTALVLRFREAEALARQWRMDECVAWFQRALGIEAATAGDHASAEAYMRSCVSIYRRCALSEPTLYVPLLATSLQNLAMVFADQRKFDCAREVLEEALNLQRQLATTHPKTFVPYVAGALTDLGDILVSSGGLPQALDVFDEALRLARAFDRHRYTHLGESLRSLGSAAIEARDYVTAKGAYERAALVYRHLGEDGARNAEGLSSALHNLAAVFGYLGENSAALKASQEAVQIRRQLAKHEARFLPDLATSLANLGKAFSAVELLGDSSRAFTECLELREVLARSNPAQHAPHLAHTLTVVAALQINDGHAAEGRRLHERALKLYRNLAQEDPEHHRLGLANTLRSFAESLDSIGQFRDAHAAGNEAVTIFRDLASRDPAHLEDLAATLTHVARILVHEDDADAARSIYEEAVGIRRQLSNARGGCRGLELARALAELGNVLAVLRLFADARSTLSESVQVFRDLLAASACDSLDLSHRSNGFG